MRKRSPLAAACAGALVTGARRERVGSRQQLRAAARRFVRRHQRDTGYLRWVLRSVGASSALAVALLGLGAQRSEAKIAPFGALSATGQDVGTYATPALGDLDGDGDLDLVSGEFPGGSFRYYENVNDAVFAILVPRTGAANPLNGLDVGGWSIPALGDLDADGDLDLLSGEASGAFFYFENTGSATAAAFVARTGTANPLNGVDTGTNSFPRLGDLDADGDLDLVAGEYAGTFRYFENTGNARVPAFVARTGAANPLNGFDVGAVASPALGDLDRDGDLDLVSGEGVQGALRCFENTGNAAQAAFVACTNPTTNPVEGLDPGSLSTTALGDIDADGDLDLVVGERYGLMWISYASANDLVTRFFGNPLSGVDIGSFSAPSFGDVDGDGDLDMLAGKSPSGFRYFRNSGSRTAPAFVEPSFASNPFFALPAASRTVPTLGDLEGDGDLDLVTGAPMGSIVYFVNTGSATSPAYVGAAPSSIEAGFYPAPALGDLDGDGDGDLVLANVDGDLFYYENTASGSVPAFTLRIGADDPLDGLTQNYEFVVPTLGDVEGDGDLDLVLGVETGVFLYFENVGGETTPEFAQLINPFGGLNQGDTSTPALGDFDGDGDLDMLAGEEDGVFNYFESFVLQTPRAIASLGAFNPLNGQDVGALAGPALADLDRDGDHDLLAGEALGTFRYFQNTGTAIAPLFVARTGAANPMNGRDVGDDAKPAFADLDADGDFDVLSGRLAGGFSYFRNTGNARTPAFATPLANPFGLSAVAGGSSAPVVGDLDADGDLDVTLGEYYGVLQWFENTGSRTNPSFVLRTGSENPFDALDMFYYSTPALADFDRDGDLDLVEGREHGRFAYFDNGRSALEPSLLRTSGSANPLDDLDVGDRSAPAAADLDANGVPDLVTGTLDGTFAVHYLPEPEQGLLLGTGVAWLAWLDRLRGRRNR